MVKRRQLIAGVAMLAGGGGAGYVLAGGEVPAVVNNLLSTGDKRVGESAEVGGVTVTPTQVAVTQELEYRPAPRDGVWAAPEGGRIALWRLEVRNDDIDPHKAPRWNTRNHGTLQEEDGVIYPAGVNDIRVYGGSDGASIPFDTFGLYLERFLVNGQELPVYPVGVSESEVAPNSTLTGWVAGLIEVEQPPALVVQTSSTRARWQVSDSTRTVTPSQNQTIEV